MRFKKVKNLFSLLLIISFFSTIRSGVPITEYPKYTPFTKPFQAYSLDYVFNNEYEIPLKIEQITIEILEKPRLEGQKTVSCTLKVEDKTHIPLFNHDTSSEVLFSKGIGNIHCPLDMATSSGNEILATVLYVKVKGNDKEGTYGIRINKRFEFSPLVESKHGYKLARFIAITPAEASAVKIPFARVIPTHQIDTNDQYTFVYGLFPKDINPSEKVDKKTDLSLVEKMTIKDIQGSQLHDKIFIPSINLKKFKTFQKNTTLKAFVLYAYLFNQNKPKEGINKTIAVMDIPITVIR
jgi:hypothetical protein